MDDGLHATLMDFAQRIGRLETSVSNIEENTAAKAARIAVENVFSAIGVDVNDPKDLQRFRDDLRFGAVARESAQKGFFALVTALVTSIGLAIWYGASAHFWGRSR